ncbi:MAG TPA: glycosyltransferase family 39 protein [Verrucomicrobiota bacterium]|nr:glycosyltransferase family 39 protein [Verrucomicrobiota bacterium]HNU49775.1 glycosyltransferase family 39 protein [Verrucomicrobiota bacterium]
MNFGGRQRWSWLVLAALVLLSSFALLGSRGLNEPDEGRYAEISREMLASGEWMIPTLHGFPHLQKPPVIYWLVAGAYGLWGRTEWAARFPCALAALGTAWLTFLMGRWAFGRRAAVAATVCLATSLGFFALARTLTPDMVFTFWITAAMAAFVRWTRRPQARGWIWLFFVTLGVGFMTKGPLVVLSLSGSKLVTYVLPLFPALALAVGAWWDQVGSRRDLTGHAVAIVGLFGGLAMALLSAMRFGPETLPAVPVWVWGLLMGIWGQRPRHRVVPRPSCPCFEGPSRRDTAGGRCPRGAAACVAGAVH